MQRPLVHDQDSPRSYAVMPSCIALCFTTETYPRVMQSCSALCFMTRTSPGVMQSCSHAVMHRPLLHNQDSPRSHAGMPALLVSLETNPSK
eukprot:2840370-Amphidinium_carterae.1